MILKSIQIPRRDLIIVLVLTFLFFQIGWLACVTLGNEAFPYIVAYVFIHSYLSSPHPKKIFAIVLSCTALGYGLDTTLTALGIFHFPDTMYIFPPLWFLGVWLIFTTLLQFSARWLSRWPIWQLSLWSAIMAPASYFAGSLMTGLVLQQPLWWTLGLIALEWAIVYPLLVKITLRILKHK